RRHQHHAAVHTETDPERRHPPPARLQRAYLEALPRADRGDERRRARRGLEGLPGRGKGGALKKMLSSPALWRGVVSIAVFLILWEIGARSKQWMAPGCFGPFRELLGAIGLKKDYLPWIGAVPAPSVVLAAWIAVLVARSYWPS